MKMLQSLWFAVIVGPWVCTVYSDHVFSLGSLRGGRLSGVPLSAFLYEDYEEPMATAIRLGLVVGLLETACAKRRG